MTYDRGLDVGAAATLARAADVAIVVPADRIGEGGDRRCLSLECTEDLGDQDGLIDAVAAANAKTIVVLQTGGPVLTPWRGRVAALLEAWYPGERGGEAIARVLLGDADPAGRLPATFPAREADGPATTVGDPLLYPGVDDQVHYAEGVLVGYRWFDARHVAPAYPFGYGRSYTSFRYSDLRVRARRGAVKATVSVRVTNTGRRPGSDVAQLYLGLPDVRAGVAQPPRQLKGFTRAVLAPGKSSVVTFPVRARDLQFWDVRAHGWRTKRGCVRVAVGRSSRDIELRSTLPVAGSRCR